MWSSESPHHTETMRRDESRPRGDYPIESRETSDRRPWLPPRVRELPKLTDLTLATGDAVDGGYGDGSTVF